jgi:phage gp29-like protein
LKDLAEGIKTFLDTFKTVYCHEIDALTPEFILYEEEDVDTEQANRDKVLIDCGVVFTKDYYKKTYGFDDADFDIADKTEQPIIPNNNPIPEKKETELEQEKMFAELLTADQQAIDKQTDEMIAKSLPMMKSYVKPIKDYLNNKSDFIEAINNISDIYPKMNTKELERELRNRLFIADLIGRLSVNNEIGI